MIIQQNLLSVLIIANEIFVALFVHVVFILWKTEVLKSVYETHNGFR